ncbi:MAG: hypothetical protein LBL49_08700 [Clostridiales Family XIII bacterium]|jgi:hypothetical protein|nr:hypothetical protein [Clostridiales Family XIII bacterium]
MSTPNSEPNDTPAADSKSSAKFIRAQYDYLSAKLNTLWSERYKIGFSVKEYRTVLSLLRDIHKTYSGIFRESDSFVNGQLFFAQMLVVLNSLSDYIEYISGGNDCKKSRLHEKTGELFANDVIKWLRSSAICIDSFSKLVVSVNLQSIQSPNFEMQARIDMEKYVIAYSEFLRKFSSDFYEHFITGDNKPHSRVLPIVTANQSEPIIAAYSIFMSGIGAKAASLPECATKADVQARFVAIVLPSVDYFHLLYDTLPLICHEISHNFRFIPRPARNEALLRYIFENIAAYLMKFWMNREEGDGESEWSSFPFIDDIATLVSDILSRRFMEYIDTRDLDTINVETQINAFMHLLVHQASHTIGALGESIKKLYRDVYSFTGKRNETVESLIEILEDGKYRNIEKVHLENGVNDLFMSCINHAYSDLTEKSDDMFDRTISFAEKLRMTFLLNEKPDATRLLPDSVREDLAISLNLFRNSLIQLTDLVMPITKSILLFADKQNKETYMTNAILFTKLPDHLKGDIDSFYGRSDVLAVGWARLGLLSEKDNFEDDFVEFLDSNVAIIESTVSAIGKQYSKLYNEVFADLCMCAAMGFDAFGYFHFLVKHYILSDTDELEISRKNMIYRRAALVMGALIHCEISFSPDDVYGRDCGSGSHYSAEALNSQLNSHLKKVCSYIKSGCDAVTENSLHDESAYYVECQELKNALAELSAAASQELTISPDMPHGASDSENLHLQHPLSFLLWIPYSAQTPILRQGQDAER